ncbi:hypothetical protein [Empedobacter tilapiae]|uniref:hypothetical protein n=1 Tax=Empedobacter tilapiae TaxID=2491114 RepID=UPI0014571390|nr:hypothetical protein [Empedobacter tilapiae]
MKLTIVSVSKVEEINVRTYIIPKKNIGINEKNRKIYKRNFIQLGYKKRATFQ